MNIRSIGRILSMMLTLLFASTQLFSMHDGELTFFDDGFSIKYTALSAPLNTNNFRLTLLSPDQEELGSITLYIFLTQKIASIDHLFIQERHRRNGYATRLLNYVYPILKNEGFTKVSLSVELSNRGARALYSKHGFTPAGNPEDDFDGDCAMTIGLVKNL